MSAAAPSRMSAMPEADRFVAETLRALGLTSAGSDELRGALGRAVGAYRRGERDRALRALADACARPSLNATAAEMANAVARHQRSVMARGRGHVANAIGPAANFLAAGPALTERAQQNRLALFPHESDKRAGHLSMGCPVAGGGRDGRELGPELKQTKTARNRMSGNDLNSDQQARDQLGRRLTHSRPPGALPHDRL
jgi:hypothetical protein